jgi:putative transposase
LSASGTGAGSCGMRQSTNRKRGSGPPCADASKLLTDARGKFTWLHEGSQVAQQQMLRSYSQSRSHWFKVKGRGRPKFKARKRAFPSLDHTMGGFCICDGRLRLPDGVSVPVVWSRELPSEAGSVRVYQGQPRVLVRVDGGRPRGGACSCGLWVYRDRLGRDHYGDCHGSGLRPALPGHRKRCAAELAKAQPKMSRRYVKGTAPSNGYQRARTDAARLHQKAANQNKHDARIWANAVVDNHQLIAVEDFKAKFLAKSTMARKSADAAVGAAKRELIERGTRAGRTVVLVPPAYTTMTCSCKVHPFASLVAGREIDPVTEVSGGMGIDWGG